MERIDRCHFCSILDLANAAVTAAVMSPIATTGRRVAKISAHWTSTGYAGTIAASGSLPIFMMPKCCCVRQSMNPINIPAKPPARET